MARTTLEVIAQLKRLIREIEELSENEGSGIYKWRLESAGRDLDLFLQEVEKKLKS